MEDSKGVDPLVNTRSKIGNLAASLVCLRCFEIAVDPHSLADCNHMFCWECIELNAKQCHVCKIPLTKKDIRRNKRMDIIIKEFKALNSLFVTPEEIIK